MYSKCMKFAEEWADQWRKANAKKIRKNSFIVSNPWVNLWNSYCKGNATEEDIKACFQLGYVGFNLEGDAGRAVKIPKNSLKKA